MIENFPIAYLSNELNSPERAGSINGLIYNIPGRENRDLHNFEAIREGLKAYIDTGLPFLQRKKISLYDYLSISIPEGKRA